MGKIYFIGILFSIISFSQNSFTQSTYIDSLKKEMPKCKNASDSVRILCQLAWNLPISNKSESVNYGKLALIKAKNLSDSTLIADAYDAAANSSRLHGDIIQSAKLYRISMNIGIRNHIPGRIAWGSYNLANILMSEGNFKEVEILANRAYKYFKQVNDQRRAFDSYWLLVKADPVQYTDSLIQFIINYLPQVQTESDKMFYYIEIANLYNKSNNRKRAMYYVQLAMELAEKNKNSKGIIKVYYQIADYFKDIQHNYPMALIYLEKINEEFTKSKYDNRGSIYGDIGEIYRLSGNTHLALSYFNRALESGKKANQRHLIASAYMELGDINYQQKNYNEALLYYIKCWDTNCDVCPKITFHDALINVGNVYSYSNELGNAKKYYQKSLEIADSAFDKKALSHSWQAFASLFEKQGDLNKAIEYHQKALLLAKEALYLEGQQYNANKLTNLYLRLNDFKKAFQYSNQSNLLKDSITKINEIDNLAKLETYFDFKNLQVQKEFDKTKSNEEIGHQKLVRNFFIIGFILAGIVGLLILAGYRRKKKANKLLYEQKLAIEEMAKKVHDADQAKLEFFTNVSHELKTPLTLIIGMTEKLKTIINESNSIDIIRKNAFKLLQLVNHLLDLRKIDTSNMKLSVKKGDLNDFLKGIINSFDNLFQQKHITIEFHTNENTFPACFDHDKLEKIFSNLLSNAVKYTHVNGSIIVELIKRNDGFTEINVSDNGIGIEENEVNNIFKRFYRVPGTNNTGSGIGLALVKELVEIHKGEIKVNCKKNQGSNFTIVFPTDKRYYTDAEITNSEEVHSNWNYADVLDFEGGDNPDAKELSEPNPDNKTILVIEDNADLRKFIADIFIDEYEVLQAQDGAEGFNKSCKYVPDIIISDIMMPNMSGIQLVDQLKGNVTTSHIPIILLTAKNDIATHLKSFEKGVDDFISKPFDSSILKSRVENLLRLRKQLVAKFSKQFQLQPREITIENADQKFVQKAIDIIEKNMSNPNLNVDLLAIELNVSRTQLYRKLSALTDYAPKHFIRIIRLKRAAQILKQGQNNIAEVMDATGFSNYSYFNNCFKDFFGKYPKDYIVLNVNTNLN